MWLDGPQANIIIYADGPSGLERTRDSLSMLVAQAHHVTLPTAEINRSQPRLAFCFRILLLCRTGNAAGGIYSVARSLARTPTAIVNQPGRAVPDVATGAALTPCGCTRGALLTIHPPTHQPYLQHQQVILHYCKHTYTYLAA